LRVIIIRFLGIFKSFRVQLVMDLFFLP